MASLGASRRWIVRSVISRALPAISVPALAELGAIASRSTNWILAGDRGLRRSASSASMPALDWAWATRGGRRAPVLAYRGRP